MMNKILPVTRNKMKLMLGSLVGFVILDGVLTEFLVRGGTAQEGNPFLQPLVGETGFMVLKIVGSLVCALIIWDIYRRFPRLATAATYCFLGFYGAVVLWNTSLLLTA